MAYGLDNTPKSLLETYKRKINNTCTHESIYQKINFKKKCGIYYKFHITKFRMTCDKLDLSLCKLHAKKML